LRRGAFALIASGRSQPRQGGRRAGNAKKSFPEKPAAVADIALSLVRQERSAWSFEVEAHTFGAKW
jgi:hypothetical protein